jgi:hypothetical protein
MAYFKNQSNARNINGLVDVINVSKSEFAIYERISVPYVASYTNFQINEIATGPGLLQNWLREKQPTSMIEDIYLQAINKITGVARIDFSDGTISSFRKYRLIKLPIAYATQWLQRRLFRSATRVGIRRFGSSLQLVC